MLYGCRNFVNEQAANFCMLGLFENHIENVTTMFCAVSRIPSC